MREKFGQLYENLHLIANEENAKYNKIPFHIDLIVPFYSIHVASVNSHELWDCELL